ncbi:putative nectin-1 isoform X2, partial [Sciurus carolinensis]|nr:putative nectin-1 isoform X2 [Sciurus carolinensis]
PLPQGGPGSVARLLGGTVAMVLILGVALSVFFLYRRQQKSRLQMGGDGTDLSPSQKLETPPDRQSHLASEDIQSLHLEPGRWQQEEELPKLPLQPPYYDLGVSPSYRPLVRRTEQ